MLHRPRILRKNKLMRELVAESRLSREMFIYPYFVTPGKKKKETIDSMPGIFRFSSDELTRDVEAGMKSGVNKILLFGTGEAKSEYAETSYSENSVVAETIVELRKNFGAELLICTDVCLCAYTSHGHCGILHDHHILNDPSVELLAKMALSHAQAGADIVAPSDMMDGRVIAIRNILNEHKLEDTGIMSYAVKYASSYYGPFRDAADSAPSSGDRKSYQMDFRNSNEAIKEAAMDEQEGADILMVKPGLAYLDIIRAVKESTLLPVACYNVSGEYSMVKAAAAKGWIDEQKTVMENMHAFGRAGASVIISYHTKEIFEKNWL